MSVRSAKLLGLLQVRTEAACIRHAHHSSSARSLQVWSKMAFVRHAHYSSSARMLQCDLLLLLELSNYFKSIIKT